MASAFSNEAAAPDGPLSDEKLLPFESQIFMTWLVAPVN